MFANRIGVAVVSVLVTAPALAHHARYTTSLTGNAVSPPTASAATGQVVVAIDFDIVTMKIDTQFSGLQGTVTEAHIHAPTMEVFSGTAGVVTPIPTLTGFPTSGSSGTYSMLFDLTQPSTFNPAFLAANGPFVSDAADVLFFALAQGKAYFDIHTTAFPDGEIRGFLVNVPGDYNNNGIVDAADYVLWRKTLGTIGEGLAADSDNSNIVGPEDYVTWREHFGETRHDQHEHHHHGGGTDSSTGVPEPASFLLIVTTLWFLMPMRRSR
jgi:hypothetical protein